MVITNTHIAAAFAFFCVGFVILIFFMIGIPIVESQSYNVTVDSKWLQRSCDAYGRWDGGCSDIPMINTDHGNFSVKYFTTYLDFQPNVSYTIDTIELGMGYGARCQTGMCRVVMDATVI